MIDLINHNNIITEVVIDVVREIRLDLIILLPIGVVVAAAVEEEVVVVLIEEIVMVVVMAVEVMVAVVMVVADETMYQIIEEVVMRIVVIVVHREIIHTTEEILVVVVEEEVEVEDMIVIDVMIVAVGEEIEIGIFGMATATSVEAINATRIAGCHKEKRMIREYHRNNLKNSFTISNHHNILKYIFEFGNWA